MREQDRAALPSIRLLVRLNVSRFGTLSHARPFLVFLTWVRRATTHLYPCDRLGMMHSGIDDSPPPCTPRPAQINRQVRVSPREVTCEQPHFCNQLQLVSSLLCSQSLNMQCHRHHDSSTTPRTTTEGWIAAGCRFLLRGNSHGLPTKVGY